MRARYCTLGELHTVLSAADVADALDFLAANEDAAVQAAEDAAAHRGRR